MADRQDPLGALFDFQGEAMREMLGELGSTGLGSAGPASTGAGTPNWAEAAGQMQAMWAEFLKDKGTAAGSSPNLLDPAQFMLMAQG